MGGHEDGGAELGDVLEQGHDLPGRFLVEVAGRLVRDQKRRLGNHRTRDRHPLLLATRQLVGKSAASVTQADRFEGVEGTVPRLCVRDPEVAYLESKGDVLDRVQPGQELVVLEHHADPASQVGDVGRLQPVRGDAGHPDLAGGGADLAVDQLQKGRLAGAAGANQEGQLARM